MGVVVDTSVFVFGERRGWTAHDAISILSSALPDQRLIMSTITAAELVHGVFRAATPIQHNRRLQVVRELMEAFAPMPFTARTAWVAGKLRGEQRKLGNALPLADSFIAALALQMDYGVLTLDVADFVRVPELAVVPFQV